MKQNLSLYTADEKVSMTQHNINSLRNVFMTYVSEFFPSHNKNRLSS